MKTSVSVLVALFLAGTSIAGEVYMTKDGKGTPIYTDRPETLPAKRVGIESADTDPAEVQLRYDEQQAKYAARDKESSKAAAEQAEAAKARKLTAEDRATRCSAARERYQAIMEAHRLYEQPDPAGDRQYLTNEEIDAVRERAKQTVEEFCGDG